MKYSDVIHKSWDLTVKRPSLKWLVFIPSFASVFILALKVAWQIYTYSFEFGIIDTGNTFQIIGEGINFLSENGLVGWVIFILVFAVIFEYVLESWVASTLMLSVRDHFEKPDKPLLLRQKMIDGLYYFFKVFKLHAILSPFQFLTTIFVTATLYRFFHDNIFGALIPFIIVYLLIAFAVNLFLAFAPYFIVYERMKVKPAIKKSIELAFLHMEKTIGLMFLMVLVNLRIVVNVLVVLGIPVAILGILSYFSASSFLTIALIIAAGVSIALIALVAYLGSIVEVFSTSVWERSFKELRLEQQEHEDENRDEDWSA